MPDLSGFSCNIFDIFNNRWAVLAAGTPDDWNCMTVSWGQMGTLWGKAGAGKNVVTVFVRSSRHTYSFMEKSPVFTLSVLPAEYKKDLLVLGSKSGRDGDKVAETSLTPVPFGGSTGFAQAELSIACKKLCAIPMDPAALPADIADRFYASEAPHVMFIGEITEISQKNG